MSEPMLPWKDGGDAEAGEVRTAALVRSAAEIAPRAVDVAGGWDDVIERVAKPRRNFRLAWLLAGAATGLAAWLLLASPRPVSAPAIAPAPLMSLDVAPRPAPVAAPAVAVEPAPVVVAEQPAPAPKRARPVPAFLSPSAGAVWSLVSENRLRLEQGRVELTASADPLRVLTPEVTLVALEARFAADVTRSGTQVMVFEGEVAVNTRRGTVTVRAGETRGFDGERPAEGSVCDGLNQARLACLTVEGRGEGLSAQSALYEKANLLSRAGNTEESISVLRDLLTRFPDGPLGPEVRLALLKGLMDQNRRTEAYAVAREFIEVCADDPRAADVQSFLFASEWFEARQR